MLEAGTKICTSCKESLPLDYFWNHPSGSHSKRPKCKACLRKEGTEFYRKRLAKNPDYNKNRFDRWPSRKKEHYQAVNRALKLKKNFSMSITDYEDMLSTQNGLCALCGTPPDEGKRLAVDHNHQTRAIRGLIHSRCNIAIAQLQDSPALCKLAAAYLERNGH